MRSAEIWQVFEEGGSHMTAPIGEPLGLLRRFQRYRPQCSGDSADLYRPVLESLSIVVVDTATASQRQDFDVPMQAGWVDAESVVTTDLDLTSPVAIRNVLARSSRRMDFFEQFTGPGTTVNPGRLGRPPKSALAAPGWWGLFVHVENPFATAQITVNYNFVYEPPGQRTW